jgi:hypothetical protein
MTLHSLDTTQPVQNLCRRCNRDFASLRAFDAHSVPDQLQDPTTWNPTPMRCLNPDELEHAGMELDARGRWHFAVSEEERARLLDLRAA